MILADVVLAARNWLPVAIALAIIALLVLAWSYYRTGPLTWTRALAGLLKAAAIVALAIFIVEPLFTGTRPKPGSNLMVVVADNSRSLQLVDRGLRETRGKRMQTRLDDEAVWLTRLGQDFDLRRYAFDSSLRPLKSFSELTLDGQSSNLSASLASIGQRLRGKPIAGIMLFTDGNATDIADAPIDWKQLPPVFPVMVGTDKGLVDLSVARVSVSQTNFEASPVTILADVEGRGIAGRKVIVRVLDESGAEVTRRTVASIADNEPLSERFLLKPERPGISFYTVQAALEGEEEKKAAGEDGRASKSAEATLANNRRLAVVDRGGGPYRVLYVSGRPNWEYKFLRRAIEGDDEVNLVGLVRVAKKEPKFAFRGRSGERTNPLFRGFSNQTDEEAEQYDEPVLIRLGTEDKDELRGGFPKGLEELFAYQAIILDDIEAGFFNQDQMSLLTQFVSRRGGGLLMLGGRESFVEGGYHRTVVGDLLPVYLDAQVDAASSRATDSGGNYRLRLTREGWLQPWNRLRASEPEETKRLAMMPGFKTVNAVRSIKPGASVLAEVEAAGGQLRPALVVQQFGRGRVGALLIADLWRWNLRRPDHAESDMDKSWRQTVRWLVADVPQAVEVETRRSSAASPAGVRIIVRARDKQFDPLDNATVSMRIHTPDKRELELALDSSDQAAGQYETTFASRVAGAYRAEVSVTGPDGSQVGDRQTGWTIEPDMDEFQQLAVNRDLLERIARETGGEVIEASSLDRFVAGLPNRKIPVTENWTYPLWHQWTVLFFAVACLVGEWGLRRWKGLP